MLPHQAPKSREHAKIHLKRKWAAPRRLQPLFTHPRQRDAEDPDRVVPRGGEGGGRGLPRADRFGAGVLPSKLVSLSSLLADGCRRYGDLGSRSGILVSSHWRLHWTARSDFVPPYGGAELDIRDIAHTRVLFALLNLFIIRLESP